MLYVALFCILFSLSGAFLLVVTARNDESESVEKSDNPVSVIIPFRNEAGNLNRLMDALEKSGLNNLDEIIFVNDHSGDDFQLEFEAFGMPYKLFHLPESESGKKRALQHGINYATHDWIVTLDADCVPGKNYFSILKNNMLANHDMLLGRVMPKTGMSKLLLLISQWESLLLRNFNISASAINSPILASGAALAFRKNCWEKAGKYNSHLSLASGDDMYLMRDFLKINADVYCLGNPFAVVYSQAPDTFKEWLIQRIRWSGKRNIYTGFGQKLIAVISLLLMFNIWVAFCVFPTAGFFILFIETAVFTYLNYSFAYIPWYYSAFFRLIYPLLVILIFILPAESFKWKGRDF